MKRNTLSRLCIFLVMLIPISIPAADYVAEADKLFEQGGLTNYKQAIELYQKHKNIFDLVALDMIMPEMSGKETYERLKKIDPDVKVLLVSGYSLNKQVEELMDLGCNGFIQKPFDILQLSQKIRDVLMAERREAKSGEAQKFERKD